MKSWFAIALACLPITLGCGQASSESPPFVVSQRTVTVSGDDAFVELEDGTRLGVDGVPEGQSVELLLIEHSNEDGTIGLDVELAAKPAAQLKRP